MSEELKQFPEVEPSDLTDEELTFDEPAPALFAPLELQQMLQNAYAWQGRARFDLFNATRTLEFRKRELLWKQNRLRTGEAYGLLKNSEQREAYLFDQCAEQINRCDAAGDEQAQARVLFENACAEVEQARALLRIAELAAATQVEDCSPFLPRKTKIG
jgi:hypothetical protein